MNKKYIEINEPYYNQSKGQFEITIDLVNEEKQEIKTKIIVIPKIVWYFKFAKELQEDYQKNKKNVDEKMFKWLIDYANILKGEYEGKWEEQPEIRVVNKII